MGHVRHGALSYQSEPYSMRLGQRDGSVLKRLWQGPLSDENVPSDTRLGQVDQCWKKTLTRSTLRRECPFWHKTEARGSVWDNFHKAQYQSKLCLCEARLTQRGQCEVTLIRSTLRLECPLWNKTEAEALIWDNFHKVQYQSTICLCEARLTQRGQCEVTLTRSTNQTRISLVK